MIALVAVAVAGTLAAGGAVSVALDRSSTLEFCVSCHSMQAPYTEYQASPHFRNASGVRAVCSDCHVPHETGPKLLAKLGAAKDVWHEALGTIDTPEKFERNRLRMAQQVWARMEATDSRECRSCHLASAMDPHKQRPKSDQMTKGLAKGESCIACHKGIAHKLPDMSSGYRATWEQLVADAASEGARANDLYTLATTPFFLDRPAAAQDGESAGKLLPASPVKVLARNGDWVQVRVSGWAQEGAERLIYVAKGQRIMTAVMPDETTEKLERGTPVLDPETELTWTPVSLTVWVQRQGLFSDINRLWAYGAEMYQASCSSCHGLTPINHFLPNQWTGALADMKNNITLDDEQYRFMLKYLQMHAGH
ncbi:NapC/NirT family cytochrome c [Rhodovastum atsumiense]|uniref:Cytochrome c-type protein n=1 Tax=Rhodovastum atsumiense TaxID=504468 RepID=A0A5M6IWF4_9PROT|nr:NapC/NirT family cytochrome c [Rhodovastum atsumiense]KAA5612551.1 cytochrome C [Rhodovastum atsumiense]